MLGTALVFLAIALTAALLGFGSLAGTAALVAQVVFFAFLAVFILSLLAGPVRGASS